MKIQENINLKPFNTFGLPANARYFCVLTDSNDVETLQQWRRDNPGLPVLFLGGGSNILFVSDFSGLIVHVRLAGFELAGADDAYHYVQASAGENWHGFVRWTIEQNLAGLENLSLIPGTVGAAPVQNIGAYGVELKDRLHQVEAIDWQSGVKRVFDSDACQFGYRDSHFKSVDPGRWIITSVLFKLPRAPQWKIDYPGIRERLTGQELSGRTISDAIIAVRNSKLPDPANLGNAGSFFKNPFLTEAQWKPLKMRHPQIPGWKQPNGRIKTSAGWLIDQCGWKGKRQGDAGAYGKHALVLVNHGNASGSQLWRFASEIIASVEDNFGVTLEPEPLVVR